MSHSYIADCSNSGGKGDDTLIIIVNSDGTLSVDPETLQKLLANQHQNSAISLVRLDAKAEGNLDGGDEDGGCDDDDPDVDSRVNLTVEGYYPPTPAPSSPTPPPTPVSETNMSTDGGGSDVLADSITEILQPEDVEKLETVLQSAHAKEILGDVVLDMLQKNEEEAVMEGSVVTQQGSVVLDHCYAALSGSAPPPPAVPVPVVKPLSPQPTRGRGRGARGGRGRGSMVQTKLTLLPSATMVPVVEQLVMPGSPGAVSVRMPSSAAGKGQATVALQRVELQQVLPTNVTPCKVMLNKVPVQAKPTTSSSPLPSGGGETMAEWKPPEADVVVPTTKKARGRGRGVTTRGGRGSAGTSRGRGRGRGVPKISEEEEAQNKRLAEEMAATVRALTLAEADKLADESMDQSADTDRVIPLVNKVPVKKPVKVYRRHMEAGPKTLKVLKPEKPKAPRKSASSESSSHEEKIAPEPKKGEKVIVVSMEPQITPAVLSAVVMSEGHSQQLTMTPATAPVPVPTPAPTPTPTTSSTPSHRKNYPKRENRKPPAHLAEAFGPALFSTPDIIRRVSTDKSPSTPTTPAPHSTPAPVVSTPQTPVAALAQTSPITVSEPATQPASAPASTEMEADLGVADNTEKEQDLLMATISSQVTKQEEQLLEEALLLEDLPADVVLQDEVRSPSPQAIQPAISSTAKNQQQKPKKQMSLSSFFPVVNQTKDESKSDTVVETPTSVVTQITAVSTPGVRKLPPVELPATRGATKRASLQKEPVQETQVKKQQETIKKVSTNVEKRKSTDSKKSTESRKSSVREDMEDALGSDEASDEEGSYNSEDDPNRLWCICKRPHNNRFMICCDSCEDWFHGKCVGITKAMGEQMEENEVEWLCPNCKKKKKQEEVAKKPTGGGDNPTKKTGVQTPVVTPKPEKEKKEASKVIVQHQKVVVVAQDTPKTNRGNEIRITKVSARKSTDEAKLSEKDNSAEVKPVNSAEHTSNSPKEDCIVCKKEALAGGVYCSDECIAKHTSESLSMIDKNAVIVFEKKTGRIYGGANAPTPATLTSWLMAHPSYQVMRPGVLPSAKFYNQSRPQPQSMLKQTVLQTKPQGIQLIAALPQPVPIEGPMKKNMLKAEASSSQKAKPIVVKGQQQITSLLKVQPKPNESSTETKAPVSKNTVTPLPPPATSKKSAKESKKTQQQPVVKKTPPATAKKPVKEETKPDQKREEGRGKEAEEQAVRASVRKTLQEVLTARLKETSDLKLSEDQIKKTAVQIEEELYALFKDTSAKYKAKYRSLMFNIKDKNNLTLFRKIADKSLSPVQLVRLSPEELASQQLAQWREREARHQLEMIKKTELDAMQQAKTVVMKTHKGEQVVENEMGIDAKVLETSVEIEPVINPSTSTESNVDKYSSKAKENTTKVKEHKHGVKEKKEENQNEHKHSHKGSHGKDHSRSRSRHRSRHESVEQNSGKVKSHSESTDEANKAIENIITEVKGRSKSRPPERGRSRHRQEERSKSKSPSETGRSKSRPREERSKSRPRERSKSRPRERSKSRPRERSKSRPRDGSDNRSRDRSKSRLRERSKSQIQERSKSITREKSGSRDRERSRSAERSKSKDREINKSRPRERSKSRGRERSKSRGRERSKSRGRKRSKSRGRSKSRPRERSKSRGRERSKSRGRERSKSRSREMSKSQSENIRPGLEENESKFVDDQTSLENIHKNIEVTIPARPAIFDVEIKDIIQDVVIQEEIGSREEDLSDREPSSTVNISTPPFNTFEEEEQEDGQKPPVWKGTLLMPDVAKFSTFIQEVSGVCGDLACDLPETINCVGRISPETAWDYIAKMKKSGTKQILVIRFSSDNEEDKMSYLSFYSYLSSRNRLGVVGNNSKMIKDFYILPLPSHSPVPQVLLPLDGPGFEDYRPHLLLGIIVRTRRKRLLTDKDIPFVPKVAKKSERSYTPPLPDEDSHTPTHTAQPDTESFTPPHSPKPPRIIKLKPRTNKGSASPTVSDDFVLEDGDTPYTPEDVDVPYSPGEDGSSSPGCSEELQRKVDQLNRMINDIEEKKQKIDSLSSIGGMSPPQEVMISTQDEEEELEEAYSPSGSISPPPTDTSFLSRNPPNISLPSDLQDIIASLKKKPEETKSIDLKSDPIVQAYRSADEPYSPEEEKMESNNISEEKPVSPTSEESVSTQLSAKSLTMKPNRDPRQRPVQLSLSQLSDEEIMKKASEMGFMNPENPEPIPDKLKSRNGADSQSSTEEVYDPFAVEEDRSQNSATLQPPVMPPFLNQTYTSSTGQPIFTPDFPPPPRPPTFVPPQFQPPRTYQAPPLSIPPSHIPFTNPQPPPSKPVYPPPPSLPAPLPPPPPREHQVTIAPKKKFSKKSKKKSRDPRSRKEKKEKKKYSESPPPKDYDYDESKFDKTRERERYSFKKREKKESWRKESYDKSPFPEKRRDSWEYEDYEVQPPVLPPLPMMPGPPPHAYNMPPGPSMRDGPMMRGGRFQRGMRGGFRRGFDRPPMRGGFIRGGFHPRGGHHMGGLGPPPPQGPPRNFAPKNIHNEFEEDIRRFEEQRLKQKNLERKRWRKDSPPPLRKRRGKDEVSD